MYRRIAVALVTLFAAVAIGACSNSDEPARADREFVASMLPHHRLGVQLIDGATRRVSDVRVRRLVFEMSGYHHSEIDELAALRDEWSTGEAVEFSGMLSSADLMSLGDATAVAYDVLWLRLMVEHHLGALVLVEAQRVGGSVDELVQLADAVGEVQREQIDAMEELLEVLCSERPVPECDAPIGGR